MKKLILIFILLLLNVNNFVFAQHTDKFLKLTENLKISDSITVIKKFKNGNVKKRETFIEIEFNDFIYTFNTSVHIFNRKGELIYEVIKDNFGNFLSDKSYSNGNIYLENNTYKIDVETNSIKEFLEEPKYTSIEWNSKEYSSNNYDEIVLIKEGNKRNNKKIGVWKTYDGCGNLIKKKEYSN